MEPFGIPIIGLSGRVSLAAPTPPPSLVFSYKTTLTDTTNKIDGETYEWTGQDIGTEHEKRIVICGVYGGNFNANHDLIVGGVAASYLVRQGNFNLLAAAVPSGATATFHVDVHTASMSRVAIAYGIYYPVNPTALSGSSFSATGTTAGSNSVLSAQQEIAGLNICFGGADAALITQTGAWGGVDAVTEHVDAQLEAATSYALWSVTLTEKATNSWTLTPSVSSSRSFVRAQWGAC